MTPTATSQSARAARPPAASAPAPRKRMTSDERTAVTATIVDLYTGDTTMSIQKIADRLGLSYGTVQRLLHDAGVEMRPRGGSRKPAQRKAAPPGKARPSSTTTSPLT
jgi:transposase